MSDLIAKLKVRMGNQTQIEFAAEIGITQATLSRILSEDRRIGIEAARKIVKRFPELESDVVAFLLSDNIPTDHSPYVQDKIAG